MRQQKIRAVFMRGGTSKAVVFRQQDLPVDRGQWDAIFLAVMGSPDPNARQLDGMGGGISSLSKVCVVGPPSHAEADIDFTFAQVLVREARVDYQSNCGNMSSAMGPFAVDESLVDVDGGEARVVIHNTNTRKLVYATFPIDDGATAVDGAFEIPGVAGSGAPVRLEFRDPGGAGSGKLLPSGNVLDVLDVAGVGPVEASMVDAANACVFIDAARVGITGTESPTELDARTEIMDMLEAIRCAAGVAMGLGDSVEDVRTRSPSNPKIGLVAAPRDAVDLRGQAIAADAGDLTARIISMGNTHRALPLTGALCLGVAAHITGTVVHRHTRSAREQGADLRILQPSGVSIVGAEVERRDAGWHAHLASVYR
ncbi:MAG: PrpF domain-containing protein, partial [Gammaproteobacteria bacterium]|nr:PrpF domain-containing protein [Gammaproteobacteria bacterium]MDX2460231.1 PrpF domain-containing protein [Gammaproteobacteria bacterium]